MNQDDYRELQLAIRKMPFFSGFDEMLRYINVTPSLRLLKCIDYQHADLVSLLLLRFGESDTRDILAAARCSTLCDDTTCDTVCSCPVTSDKADHSKTDDHKSTPPPPTDKVECPSGDPPVETYNGEKTDAY